MATARPQDYSGFRLKAPTPTPKSAQLASRAPARAELGTASPLPVSGFRRHSASARCDLPAGLPRWLDDGERAQSRSQTRPTRRRKGRRQILHDASQHQGDARKMSRPIKPARLWLELARRRPNGAIRPAAWVILDRGRKYSTGRAEADRVGAEAAFERYLAQKRLGEITEQPDHGTDAAEVYVADALALYASEQIEPRLTPQRTREFRAKIANLGAGLGTLTLAQLDGSACIRYARARRADAAARRELEDLRAAVAFYCRRKRIPNPTEIVLPERGDARERWLSREEAARLLRAAWRKRQTWKGQPSDRATGKHVARFILVALYTGTRAGAICAAGFERVIGR